MFFLYVDHSFCMQIVFFAYGKTLQSNARWFLYAKAIPPPPTVAVVPAISFVVIRVFAYKKNFRIQKEFNLHTKQMYHAVPGGRSVR